MRRFCLLSLGLQSVLASSSTLCLTDPLRSLLIKLGHKFNTLEVFDLAMEFQPSVANKLKTSLNIATKPYGTSYKFPSVIKAV